VAKVRGSNSRGSMGEGTGKLEHMKRSRRNPISIGGGRWPGVAVGAPPHLSDACRGRSDSVCQLLYTEGVPCLTQIAWTRIVTSKNQHKMIL